MKYLLSLLFLLAPGLSFAATDGSLQGLIVGIGGFINAVLIPLVLGIAFLVFIINVVRYFIIESNSEEGQTMAKSLTFYSLGAFVFILSFWGIINMLINGLGFNSDPCLPISDYVQSGGTSCPQPKVESTAPIMTNPVNPDSSDGSGITLPGTDVAPSIGTSPTQFTPDGTPIESDPVSSSFNIINTKSKTYFETTATSNFGKNLTEVQSKIFAGFNTTPNGNTSSLDRVKASYRLLQLGVINDQQFNSYLTAVNEREPSIITPEMYSSNLAVPLTTNVINNIDANKQALTTALNNYNVVADMSPTINVADTIKKLYDDKSSYQTREDLLIDLFDNGTIPESEKTLYRDFINNQKTEQIFKWSF